MGLNAIRFVYYNWHWTILFILTVGASIGLAVGIAMKIVHWK